MPGREVSRNQKIESMRARHRGSGRFVRGDLVVVEPTRGPPIPGLVVDAVEHELYGLMYDVLAGGRLVRVMADRLSRPGARG